MNARAWARCVEDVVTATEYATVGCADAGMANVPHPPVLVQEVGPVGDAGVRLAQLDLRHDAAYVGLVADDVVPRGLEAEPLQHGAGVGPSGDGGVADHQLHARPCDVVDGVDVRRVRTGHDHHQHVVREHHRPLDETPGEQLVRIPDVGGGEHVGGAPCSIWNASRSDPAKLYVSLGAMAGNILASDVAA